MSSIGIKVPVSTPLVKCVTALRPLMPFSIADLKNKIQMHDYIYTCDYIDTDGIRQIINMYMSLRKAGIIAECFEHDRPCAIEFFRNLRKLHAEVARQLEMEDRYVLGD